MGPTVTVRVGPTLRVFNLHEAFLCHVSAFFKGALEGSFKEASTKSVDLIDIDLKVFYMFVGWLYYRKVHNVPEVGKCTEPTKLDCIQLYLFGDRHGIPELQDAAINALYAVIFAVSKEDDDIYNFVYQNTPANSALRKFIVHAFVHTCGKDKLCRESSDLDFVFDVANAAVDFVCSGHIRPKCKMEYWKEVDLCQFHQHLPGMICSSVLASTPSTSPSPSPSECIQLTGPRLYRRL